MTDPAYAGGEQLPIPFPTEPGSWRDITGSLEIAVRTYKNGHACTSITRFDVAQRLVHTEKLSCYQLAAGTRVELLALLGSAVTEALGDARS